MVFSSIAFICVFLPAFLVVYVAVPRLRNIALLAFSLLFYFAGEGWGVLIMGVSIAINYFGALLLSRTDKDGSRFVLTITVMLNLVVLGYYKYFGFFVGDILGLSPAGLEDIRLPLGISFFIFQGMSYVIDVYRRQVPAQTNPLNVALYISMFPQLIAGPIVRYETIVDEISTRQVYLADIYHGCLFFCLGLASKVLIADPVATVADFVFSQDFETLSRIDVFIGAVAYSIQILFDFSGYSAMAIGLGRICGFHFLQNFNFPYTATSITEFWRRWHISLSTWFRDYLYIPLGGNRQGDGRTYFNLVMVFTVTGLWHGAAWSFLIWGWWHGLALVLERLGLGAALKKGGPLIGHIYCLMWVLTGWILFRAEGLDQAMSLIGILYLGGHELSSATHLLGRVEIWLPVISALLLATGWPWRLVSSIVTMPSYQKGAVLGRQREWGLGCLLMILLFGASMMEIASGSFSPFIYFRF